MASREALLNVLAQDGEIGDSREFCKHLDWDHEVFVGIMKSLASRQMIEVKEVSENVTVVSAEGRESVEAGGSPEYRVLSAIEPGITKDELQNKVGPKLFKIGFSYCMKNKWVAIASDTNVVSKKVDAISDDVYHLLKDLEHKQPSAEQLKALKARKLIENVTRKKYSVIKGAEFSTEIRELTTDLTADILNSGAWEKLAFKPYNFARDVQGRKPDAGNLNTLLKMRTMYREIFLEMGFEEMPTNNFVESSFWNFDALFQPQQHPARDAHDTFFLSAPAETLKLPADYVAKVKDMHENGGEGSIGWRYDWKESEAKKNLLRTHTTAVSSRMLYALAKEKEFSPKKFFSIDRVFRNESLDATHLAEFHQVEGLVADYNLTLGNLMGIIRQFFEKLGITKLKFKPAYNPYTEPSMEVFSWHEHHKKWLEIGNSGVFRPEMLRPMGLPKGVQVIAWGLSLERPTMIKYGISNIRTLVGYKLRIPKLQSAAICRRSDKLVEKEAEES